LFETLNGGDSPLGGHCLQSTVGYMNGTTAAICLLETVA